MKRVLFSVFLCVLCGDTFLERLGAADCNLNGVEDTADIEAGISADCNANGIPDACDLVPLTFGTLDDPLAFDGEPRALASGDLDGDGLRDFVVGTDSGVNIFFSRGGAFDAGPVLDSAGLLAVEAADLDTDGDLDLVTVANSSVKLFGGDGAGSFEPTLDLVTSGGAEGFAACDVDGDGPVDLVTWDPGAGSMTWFRNRGEGGLGAGSFGEGRSFQVTEPQGNSSLVKLFWVAADLDGDGDADFAIAGGRDLSIIVLETARVDGAARVSLSEVHSIPVGSPLTHFLVADVDGDRLPDLVAATRRRTVSIWRNLADGGFDDLSTLPRNPDSMCFADLDTDGRLDLLVGGRDLVGPTMEVLRGGGDGTFHAPQTVSADGSLFWPDDFDADGDGDLLVAAPGRVAVLFQGERGERDGILFASTRYPASTPHFMDLGEFNGDGIPDVVTADRGQQTGSLYFGRPDGTLGEHMRPFGGSVFEAVVAIDLNEDGADDVVFRGSLRLFAFLNKGDGTFEEATLYDSIGSSLSLFAEQADVDGDGHADILAPHWQLNIVGIHFGDGRGGLSAPLVLDVGRHPWSVAAGDLDADGDVDLVTSDGVSANLSLLLQEEAPRSFAPALNVPMEGRPRGVELADFDRDGDLDFVVVSEGIDDDVRSDGGGEVTVFLNPGDGRIARPDFRVPLGREPAAVTVADMDQDDFLDLVTTDSERGIGTGADGVSILRGRGDGTFSQPQLFRTDSNPRRTLSADMDADGDLDLVVAHRDGNSVFVLLNETVASIPGEALLETVCTEGEFGLVSVSEDASPSDARTKFLLPAREDPALLGTLFINVARFPFEQEFLREVFPERFGDLSTMGFNDLVLRRASRDYFMGSVRHLLFEDGSVAYGFDVLTDEADPGELLTFEETEHVFTRLRESFQLEPLVYFPTKPEAREAAREWASPPFPIVVSEGPGPELEGNPTFLLEVPADTALCGIFALSGAGRGPRDERELKSVVRLREGTIPLPTDSDTFTAELFEEVRFGPEGLPAEPTGSGTFRVVRIPAEVTTYRFTYSQPFALADGRRLELEVVSPILYQARGDEPVTESQPLPEGFFATLNGREPLQARLDSEPLVRYGSCSYDALPLWEVAAELADGTTIRLEERYEEAESLKDTGPASLVRAEVLLAREPGEHRVVTDYYDLVYSAARHNTLVDYWVVFDPPISRDGIGTVHVLELRAPETFAELDRDASAAYLGADYEVLASPAVASFSRTPLIEARFLRGDADGDETLDITDAIEVLRYLFERGELPCASAADANDDGRVNIVDAVRTALVLFGNLGGLPEPFPNCGADPTEDGLSCLSGAPCL